MCDPVCVYALSTVRAYSYCSLTSRCIFLMCASVYARECEWKCVCELWIYWECWWIYFRLKESLSKGIALVWQQTFKACWKHSHLNKESFIKSKLALFTNCMQTPFLCSFIFQNWQNIFYVSIWIACFLWVHCFDGCMLRYLLIVPGFDLVSVSFNIAKL